MYMDHIGLFIQQHDRNASGMENIADFIAYDFRYRFDIQCLCHRFAHTIEDGEFVYALMLRLKCTDAGQCRCDMLRNKDKDLYILLAIINACCVALNAQCPKYFSACLEWNDNAIFGRCAYNFYFLFPQQAL